MNLIEDERLFRSVELSTDAHDELEPVASDANDHLEQPLENTTSPDHHFESPDDTTAMEHDAAEQQPNIDSIP